MERLVALAALYVALGVGVAALAGEVPAAAQGALRWSVLFGLPLAVGMLGVALVRRPAAGAPLTPRLGLLAAGLVGLDLAPVGVGYLLHQVTFTFGDQTLEAGRFWAMLFGLPAVVAVTVFGWERGLRERLAGGAVVAGRRMTGAALSMLCGAALSLVAFAPGFEVMDGGFVVAAGGTALLREATALRLYGAGGLVGSGVYRGLLAGIEGLAIADWASFWFPAANFVSSEPAFVGLRLAGPATALVAALWLARGPRGAPR